MLLEFSVENFRSIGERQTLDLTPTAEQNHRGSVATRGTVRGLKVAGIFGANASGKSNLIRAMAVMEQIVRVSATKLNVGDPIVPIVPFRLRPGTKEQPTTFELRCAFDGVTYIYGFSATQDRIVSEWLDARKGRGKTVRWLERATTDEPGSFFKFDGPLRSNKDAKLVARHTRDNCLALSRGAELDVDLFKPLYLWFKNNVWVRDLASPTELLTFTTAKRMVEDAEFSHRVIELLRDGDVGIHDVSVVHGEVKRPDRPFDAPPEIVEFLDSMNKLLDVGSMQQLSIVTRHRTGDGRVVEFDMEDDESNGTQRLFALCSVILGALDNGDLLVVDELDCSLHPWLTRKIVQLFLSEQWNQNGAQLVFTSHDVSLFESDLFRRDQLWLAEKSEGGESQYTTLADFEHRPRKNEALSRRYLQGRYGGVPNFGPRFDALFAE